MAENKTNRDHAAQAVPPILGRDGPAWRPMGKVEHAKDKRGTIRRLWGYLKRQRSALIATALMVTLSTGLNVLGPYLLGLAIDQYILPGDLPGLARISLLMLGVYALTSLLIWVQSYVMVGAAQRTVRDI